MSEAWTVEEIQENHRRTGQCIVRQRIAHWVDCPSSITDEERKEAQDYLRKIIEIQAFQLGWRFLLTDIEFQTTNQHADSFTTDRVVIIASVRAYLTERQELEHVQSKTADRIIHLARSLASDTFALEYMESDDDDAEGRHETQEEAKERYRAELAQAEANFLEIRERLNEMKLAEWKQRNGD